MADITTARVRELVAKWEAHFPTTTEHQLQETWQVYAKSLRLAGGALAGALSLLVEENTRLAARLPREHERFVRCDIALVEMLKTDTSPPVTMGVREREGGEFEFIATRYTPAPITAEMVRDWFVGVGGESPFDDAYHAAMAAALNKARGLDG